MDPSNTAYTVGRIVAYLVFIGIPVSLIALIWWIPYNRRRKTEAHIRTIQDELKSDKRADASLLAAMNELETGNPDKLTWGKALIAADGDEKRAKIEYLKMRKL